MVQLLPHEVPEATSTQDPLWHSLQLLLSHCVPLVAFVHTLLLHVLHVPHVELSQQFPPDFHDPLQHMPPLLAVQVPLEHV
jgi:hypothetical protein